MYPGTIFNWHDNSAIQTSPTSNVEDGTPLFMQAFSCDKGTEDLIEIAGTDFDAMYGKMDFFRHGQSAIQAKNIIDHGGKLFAKRVVAEDSTLANTVLLAHISSISEDDKLQKASKVMYQRDSDGKIVKDPDTGEPLVEVDPNTGEPVPNADYDARYAPTVDKMEPKMIPEIDPETGDPVIDPDTGEPVLVPEIDPETGEPVMEPVIDPETGKPVQEKNPQYNEKLAEAKAMIKWEAKSLPTHEDASTGTDIDNKTFEDVEQAAKALYEEGTDETVIPLLIYAENGRGTSGKAVRLTPDYVTSRTVGKTFYNLSILEGNNIIEKKVVSFDPDLVYADVSYRLDKYTNVQICGEVIEDMYYIYLSTLADLLVIDQDKLRNYDIVYGYTNRGDSIDGWWNDPSGADLDAEIGVKIDGGSTGTFGDGPFSDGHTPSSTAAFEAWKNAIIKVFGRQGEEGGPDPIECEKDEVYDVDQHKIAAVIDADYPDEVKDVIFDFVAFREDCVFLRDFGTADEYQLDTFAGINARYNMFMNRRNYFTADYCTVYNILDPGTKKVIKVTMLFDLAANLIDHIRNNANAPVAGIVNNFILESPIKGTISFVPVVTPTENQKKAIDDIRVNYAIFNDNNCVVQSCYTCQMPYTQLSYLGNVIGIQEVLRAIRTACPKNRYSLSTGNDLSNYAQAVNDVLANYISNFSVLNFVYVQDDLKASQKIFYASIEFAFLNWAQTEIFDIYAINNY